MPELIERMLFCLRLLILSKMEIYVNMEGRPSLLEAVSPPGSAKTGVEIVNIVARALDFDIKADELSFNS